MNWYLDTLKKSAIFTGRSSRREFWMFILFNLMVVLVLGLIEEILGLTRESDRGVLTSFFQLAMLIPSIAVGARRMHDTDHSGWWSIVPVVNLIFAVTKGTRGDNRFGPDPKVISQTA